jgi:hypothetical protein
MDNFVSMLVNSRYMDMMDEFGVRRGTFLGSTWIDHNPTIVKTYTQNDMTELLKHWVDDGVVPEVPASDDSSHVYMIYTPTEISLTIPDPPPGGFCAYHFWGHHNITVDKPANLFYGVMRPTTGTDGVSHELAEICTDRSGKGWYTSDVKGAEIGDVCAGCGFGLLTLNGFQVDSYWLVREKRCLQQDDLKPPKVMNVAISPASLPLNKPVTITITATDAASGAQISDATAVIENYSATGAGPYSTPVPGVGSPLTATVTFHAGKEIIIDDDGKPQTIFDLSPSITVKATGFPTMGVLPDFPMLA